MLFAFFSIRINWLGKREKPVSQSHDVEKHNSNSKIDLAISPISIRFLDKTFLWLWPRRLDPPKLVRRDTLKLRGKKELNAGFFLRCRKLRTFDICYFTSTWKPVWIVGTCYRWIFIMDQSKSPSARGSVSERRPDNQIQRQIQQVGGSSKRGARSDRERETMVFVIIFRVWR